MEKILIIDIGSNTVRADVFELDALSQLTTIERKRAQIPLGEAFSPNADKYELSKEQISEVAEAMTEFISMGKAHSVSLIKAVATSAVREASNQEEFIQIIGQKTGITPQVIPGLEEARLISLAVRKKLDLKEKGALLVDVGGGSIEVTFMQNERTQFSVSLPLGTLQILKRAGKNGVDRATLQKVIHTSMSPLMKNLVLRCCRREERKIDIAVVTGGSIGVLSSLPRHSFQGPFKEPRLSTISINMIMQIIDSISEGSTNERVQTPSLSTNGANVILPAYMIVAHFMRRLGIESIELPRVSLKHGIAFDVYQKLLEQ